MRSERILQSSGLSCQSDAKVDLLRVVADPKDKRVPKIALTLLFYARLNAPHQLVLQDLADAPILFVDDQRLALTLRS